MNDANDLSYLWLECVYFMPLSLCSWSFHDQKCLLLCISVVLNLSSLSLVPLTTYPCEFLHKIAPDPSAGRNSPILNAHSFASPSPYSTHHISSCAVVTCLSQNLSSKKELSLFVHWNEKDLLHRQMNDTCLRKPLGKHEPETPLICILAIKSSINKK